MSLKNIQQFNGKKLHSVCGILQVKVHQIYDENRRTWRYIVILRLFSDNYETFSDVGTQKQ